MRFKKYDLVTEGTDDAKRGTIAAVKDEHEADPLYLVAFHNRPAEWIRGHYLYGADAR
ncbi:MAG: hypothetical protein V4477_17055 [Pseudomonadota bacterium]|jgi:hypothetical protein